MTPVDRILALDLGEKRIGLALSDPLGVTAQPLPRIDRRGPRKDPEAVVAVVREYDVVEVVLGLPLTLSGEEGTQADGAREFGAGLAAILGEGVTLSYWDERLTTREAERVMIDGGARRNRRKDKIDSLAATIILQNVLDTRGSGFG